MTAVVAVLSVVVAVLAVLVVGLLRSHAEVLRSLHQLGVNHEAGPPPSPIDGRTHSEVPDGRTSSAPTVGERVAADIVGTTPAGDTVRISVVGTRRTTLIAFLTTGCASCASVWRDIATDSILDTPDDRLVVVTRGPELESPGAVAALAPPGASVIQSTEAWDAYGITGAPYFVLVDGARGIIQGEGSALAWSQVRELLGRASADQAHTRRRSRREVLTGRRREEMADRKLAEAGIRPGDPSLYATDVINQDDGA